MVRCWWLKSLVLVAVTTIGLLILDQFFALRHVTLVYLVPVVIAATKLGICAGRHRGDGGRRRISILLLPADLQLSRARPATSDRAPALRLRRDRHRASRDQSAGNRPIWRAAVKPKCRTFTRSRAGSLPPTPPSDIYTAIREHLASIIGRRTILFETGAARRSRRDLVRRGEGAGTGQAARPRRWPRRRKASRTGAWSTMVKGTSGSFGPCPAKAGDFGVLADRSRPAGGRGTRPTP